MRIGIDYRPVTAAPYSGIARQVLALEAAITARESVSLFRYTACPLDHAHRQTTACPAWASPVNGLHRPAERWKFEMKFLPDAIRAGQLDVYIATANTGLPVLRTPRPTRYILLLHDLFQITLQNHHATWFKALAYRMIDWLGISRSVALADSIWTPSQFTASEVARLFPGTQRRTAVLPNAVPYRTAVKGTALPAGVEARYWLVVGTREPRKNIPWFVEIWRQARFLGQHIPQLVIVGAPIDLPSHLRELPGLLFITGISDDGLLALYAHAECLWQPSRAEGFGLPVAEALSQGTPVAVATGSALDEVAPPSAPRFSPDDGIGLLHLMQRLAKSVSPEGRDSYAAWAEKYAMPQYTLQVWSLIDKMFHA